jgi:hypothetical protein
MKLYGNAYGSSLVVTREQEDEMGCDKFDKRHFFDILL